MDGDIVLTGTAAAEFVKRMNSIDLEAIKARDKFISDVHCWNNEEGILTIDISDLNIDMSLLDTDIFDTIPISQRSLYKSDISVEEKKCDEMYLTIFIENKELDKVKNAKYRKKEKDSAYLIKYAA